MSSLFSLRRSLTLAAGVCTSIGAFCAFCLLLLALALLGALFALLLFFAFSPSELVSPSKVWPPSEVGGAV